MIARKPVRKRSRSRVRPSATARTLVKRVRKAWLSWNALMPGVRPDVGARGLDAKARAAQVRWARARTAWFKALDRDRMRAVKHRSAR